MANVLPLKFRNYSVRTAQLVACQTGEQTITKIFWKIEAIQTLNYKKLAVDFLSNDQQKVLITTVNQMAIEDFAFDI